VLAVRIDCIRYFAITEEPLKTQIPVIAALYLICIMLPAPAAFAEYIEPQNVSIKTESYQPQTTSFPTGTYRYDVAWQGIPVASAEVEVDSEKVGDNSFFRVQARAKTGSVIDVFYRLRHKSESVFKTDTLKPQHFTSWQKENSREKSREVAFNNDGTVRATGRHNGEQVTPLEFSTDNFILDPISAAFVARSLPIYSGEDLAFDVFNGKHRYLISFHVDGREKLEVGGREHEAFRVTPSVHKLTDSEGEKRLSSATLWVSTGPEREVLKLESKVLVGRVSASLASFKPAPSTAGTVQQVRLVQEASEPVRY